jgi:hypothetical protein
MSARVYPKASRPWAAPRENRVSRSIKHKKAFRIIKSDLLERGGELSRGWAAASLREDGFTPGDLFSTQWRKARRCFIVRDTNRGQRLIECDPDGLPVDRFLVLCATKNSFREDDPEGLRITG